MLILNCLNIVVFCPSVCLFKHNYLLQRKKGRHPALLFVWASLADCNQNSKPPAQQTATAGKIISIKISIIAEYEKDLQEPIWIMSGFFHLSVAGWGGRAGRDRAGQWCSWHRQVTAVYWDSAAQIWTPCRPWDTFICYNEITTSIPELMGNMYFKTARIRRISQANKVVYRIVINQFDI